MPILDKQGRVFGRINLIDLVVVLGILAGAAKLLLGHLGGGGVAKPLSVTLLVSPVRMATVNAVRPGDPVYNGVTNSYLGKVTTVTDQPAPILVKHADGTYTESVSPVYKDLYITLAGAGTVAGTGSKLGKTSVYVGDSLSIKSTIFAVTGTVWSVRTGG